MLKAWEQIRGTRTIYTTLGLAQHKVGQHKLKYLYSASAGMHRAFTKCHVEVLPWNL